VHRTFHEDDARIWGAEILLALEYLHSMDLIYRDLKPENVLLSSQAHVKLTDFGLARDVNDELTAKTVAGSPYYMAPEVLLMKGHDTQADWWSLGILIYEMLTVRDSLKPQVTHTIFVFPAHFRTGIFLPTLIPPLFSIFTQGLPPFYDDDAKKAYQKLLTCPIEFPATVSLAAQGLIRGLLAVDPAKRLGARLNAQEQQNQHKIIAASWGDGMPIKRHEWFKSLHWDEVRRSKNQGENQSMFRPFLWGKGRIRPILRLNRWRPCHAMLCI
jgi:serine/threonine protein kinase